MSRAAEVFDTLRATLVASPPPGFTTADVDGFFDRHRAQLMAELAPLDRSPGMGTDRPHATAHPALPPHELFNLEARPRHQALAAAVMRVLTQAQARFRSAGLPLEGKGPIRVVLRGKGDRSTFDPADNTLTIGLVHAARVDRDHDYAVYHELAHWYHHRMVGDIAAIRLQYARVRREPVTGGSVSDRAKDELRSIDEQDPDRFEKVRRLIERQNAAVAGTIDDEVYRNLRSPWVPTEYARKDHFEWFAELVTTHVLYPDVLSEPVRTWLMSVAHPHQETGDLRHLFHVQPKDCLRQWCSLHDLHRHNADVRVELVTPVRQGVFSIPTAEWVRIRANPEATQGRYDGRDRPLRVEPVKCIIEGYEDVLRALGATHEPLADTTATVFSYRAYWRLARPVRPNEVWIFEQQLALGAKERCLPANPRQEEVAGLAHFRRKVAHLTAVSAFPKGSPVRVRVLSYRGQVMWGEGGDIELGFFVEVKGDEVLVRLPAHRNKHYYLQIDRVLLSDEGDILGTNGGHSRDKRGTF